MKSQNSYLLQIVSDTMVYCHPHQLKSPESGMNASFSGFFFCILAQMGIFRFQSEYPERCLSYFSNTLLRQNNFKLSNIGEEFGFKVPVVGVRPDFFRVLLSALPATSTGIDGVYLQELMNFVGE